MDDQIALSARLLHVDYQFQGEARQRVANPSRDTLSELARHGAKRGLECDVLEIEATLEAKPRKPLEGDSARRHFSARVYALFRQHLDPSKGFTLLSTTTPSKHPSAKEVEEGIKTQYGDPSGAARITLTRCEPLQGIGVREAYVRLDIVLAREACVASGLATIDKLIGANARAAFGQYLNLVSSSEVRLGDLNARLRREFQRAFPASAVS